MFFSVVLTRLITNIFISQLLFFFSFSPRYDDARDCLRLLLTRKENDVGVNLAMSRLEGWADNWSLSRRCVFVYSVCYVLSSSLLCVGWFFFLNCSPLSWFLFSENTPSLNNFF